MADIAAVAGGVRSELVTDLSWPQYKQAVGLNPSTIVHGLTSMKHLKHAWDHGRPDSDAMRWGRALHCLLFQTSEFPASYGYWEGRRAGNDWKDFSARAILNGMEILPKEGRLSWDLALKASESFIHEPIVHTLISAGLAEVTVFAQEFGIQCRGRIDWISTSEHCLVDLKTTRSIESRSFGRDFYRYHYDLKLGLYQRWLNRVTGRDWTVEVIAIENAEPFDVAVIPIGQPVLDRGAEKGLQIIEQVEECIKTGEWPGVAKGERYWLDTPSYEMDDELEGAEEWEEADGVQAV